MRKNKLIFVEWVDTTTIPDWYSEFNVKNLCPTTIHSVGWLIKSDKDFIVIAASFSPTSELFSQISCIPKGCIVTHYDLNLPKIIEANKDV